MEYIHSTVQRIDSKLLQEAPELARDRQCRAESWIWRLLCVFDSPPGLVLSMILFMLWNSFLVVMLGLGPRPLSDVHFLLFWGVLATELAIQFAAIQLIKLLWLNYTWLLALGGRLWALWQREFPAPRSQDSDKSPETQVEGLATSITTETTTTATTATATPVAKAQSTTTEAYRTQVALQRDRLDGMIARYTHRKVIALANDIDATESLFPENVDYLRDRGYELAHWAMPAHQNSLRVCREPRGIGGVSCVLF